MDRLRIVCSTKIRFFTRVVAWCFLVLVSMGPTNAWTSEATLRAAFVYNFIKFIQWPEMDTSGTVQLCAIGAADDSRHALDELQGKKANKRIIKIRYLDNESHINNRLSGCHLLYRPLHATAVKLPEQLPGGMLLVVDEPTKYHASIAITLTKNEEGRIEFGINPTAVSQSGLVISSQLLKLSKKPRFAENAK